MSRPSGVTPRGLPFPGSDDTHPRTPVAIEALAVAIGGALGGISGGLIVDRFHGVVSVGGGGWFVLSFPRLAVVNGWFGTPGVDLGGTLTPGGWLMPAAGGASGGTFVPAPAGFGQTGPIPATITVHAIGWGPPL